MKQCKCGSYAFNLYKEDIDQGDLCDVHYWKEKALAQPEHEPLEYWNAVEGWVKIDEVREHFDSVGCGTIYKTAGEGRVPLTTAQRTWVGLTKTVVGNYLRRHALGDQPTFRQGFKEGVAFAEAKLKEKNT